MNDIDLIYCNRFGTSFYLKRCTIQELNKIQLVFNKVAFHFTKEELTYLQQTIKASLKSIDLITNCNKECESMTIVLEIADQELCLHQNELKAFSDLVEGTLFQLNFDAMMTSILNR